MIDELRQIAIFAKAIDHGSFRGAAQELRLSPSVVSHHIAQLENRLGVALIYRSTRKLTLTREGEKLLNAARDMVAAAEMGLNALQTHSEAPSGELLITLPSVLSQSHVIGALAEFGQRYPKIKLQLDFSDERKNLVNQGYDLAIRMGPDRKRGPNKKHLFMAHRILVAAPSYLETHPKLVTPIDLDGHIWVEFTPVRQMKTVFRKSGLPDHTVKLTPQISTNDALALCQLASSGAGLAIVPDFLVTKELSAGQVQHILPDWDLGALEAFAEWPVNAPKDGITRLLVNELAVSL